jgi:two-component system, cell cycle sensor histidine kinase and response regulator CckA
LLDVERSLELLDRVGEGILTLDTAGRVTYLNRTAEQFVFSFFGLPTIRLLHEEIWTALPQLVGTRFEAEARRFAASPSGPGEVEFEESLPPLGRWFAVRIATTDGGVLCSLRDVTDRRAAQDALARWARIFEHAGWGVAILSADGATIETTNPAFARMHGWEVEELAGRPASVLQAPRRSDVAMERIVRDRGHHIWESEHTHRDGFAFPVLVDVTIVKDDAGEPLYHAVNVQDLTERKRAEEQVRQAQKMEAVGRLAGGVAHDFNNMMMIILGFSDFLLSTLEHDDPRRADAEEIHKAADRAQHLTRQLLSFGRQQLVARQVLSLNEVVSGLERMLRPLLGENVQLAIHLAASPGAVEADQGQLEQVLMNLAINARDAMRGGGQLTIETLDVVLPEGYGYEQVGIEIPPGPYVMLRVGDTGHGMTPEVKARIFEPFFTTKPAERNTGLGLATVYGIIAQSSGYISVDSEAGAGAVFTIYLPHAMGEDLSIQLAVPAEMPPGGAETVLLVEDEEAVRTLARRVLVNQGYTVLEAANGREALELATQPDVSLDLIVTDVIMPELGGQELVSRLIGDRPGARVVYMSGYSEADKLLPAAPDPAYSFLQKPFSPENLALKVREALDRDVPLPN